MDDQRKRFVDLVLFYLNDVIDQPQMAELNAMLADNAEFRDFFVRLYIQDGLMAEKMAPMRSIEPIDEMCTEDFKGRYDFN